MTTSNSGSKPITIGVVIPLFWTDLYFNAFLTLRDTAKKNNINLLCFQGTYLKKPYSTDYSPSIDSTGEIIYNILSNKRLDGIIVLTGALKHYDQKIELFKNLERFSSIPIIHIGSKIDSLNNILISNDDGITAIMNHLLDEHCITKFAFIGGSSDNADNTERYEAFSRTLTTRDLVPVFVNNKGYWTQEWGSRVASLILDKFPETQAIICASDVLAYGVYAEFNERNLLIPDTMIVTGFNDFETSLTVNPPLTTVKLNLKQRCKDAVQLIIQSVNGKTLPKETIIPSTPVIRQSCGCPPSGIMALSNCKRHSPLLFCKPCPDLNQYKTEYTSVISTLLQFETMSTELSDNFVSILFSQLSDLSQVSFLTDFKRLLYRTLELSEDTSLWHWVLSYVHDRLPELIPFDQSAIVEQLLLKARILINELSEQENKVALMRIEERNAMTNMLNYQFNKADTIDKIISLLYEDLPKLGVSSCYLSIYEKAEAPLEISRLILAYNTEGPIAIPEHGILFPSRQLIPETILIPDLSNLFIEPLFYNRHQLGFVIFEIGSAERSFYELFSSLLSATLWNAVLLVKETEAEATLKAQTQKLEQSNIDLEKWKLQLEEAYRQLQSNQEKLLISEKMASLGRLTAGITHEMNTPLATLKASLGELHKLGNEYLESIDDTTVTTDDHKSIVRDMTASVNLADKAAERAATFIRSIRAQTRDLKDEPSSLFNIIETIENVIVFLGHSLKHGKCNISTSFSSNKIEVFGLQSKMTQVFTNLITNAIDALADRANRQISIAASVNDSSELVVGISDNGCGIPEENLVKIFEPMFTTKAFGHGTGLGLSIVHDIIHGEFGGSMEVQSKVDIGTTFIIRINLIENLEKYSANK